MQEKVFLADEKTYHASGWEQCLLGEVKVISLN